MLYPYNGSMRYDVWGLFRYNLPETSGNIKIIQIFQGCMLYIVLGMLYVNGLYMLYVFNGPVVNQ